MLSDGNKLKHLFSIILLNSFILMLPNLKGYYFFGRDGNDIFFHIYQINNIIESGKYSNLVYYPIFHILISILALFGIDINHSILLIQIILF